LIGPFEGPVLKKTGHARLLYLPHDNPKSLWSEWPEKLNLLDDYLKNQPRLNTATDKIYLYFFGPDKSTAWFGREIIGHPTRLPEGLASFDSFASEVFEWRLPRHEGFKLTGGEVLGVEKQLRSLAQEALAPTWRVEISGVEPWMRSVDNYDVAFQFYKLV
jgi:hypothetical protein